jgi:hypothetical protein
VSLDAAVLPAPGPIASCLRLRLICLGFHQSRMRNKIHITWHSEDNRECAKRVSLICCRDISHSSYADISRFIRLWRLRLLRRRRMGRRANLSRNITPKNINTTPDALW